MRAASPLLATHGFLPQIGVEKSLDTARTSVCATNYKLELNLALKLDHSRRPDSGIDDARIVRLSEVLVIEKIENLCLQPQPHSLLDRRDFEEGGIDIVESRSGHVVARDVIQIV